MTRARMLRTWHSWWQEHFRPLRSRRRKLQGFGPEALEDRTLLTPLPEVTLVKDLGNLDYNATGLPTESAYYFELEEFGADTQQLWISDGTAAGTRMLGEFSYLHLFDWSYRGNPYLEYHGEMYFAAYRGDNDNGLWKTDGTPEGTVLVAPIPYSPQYFTLFHDRMYFAASDDTHGRELWSSDGTAVGTQMVVDLYPGSGSGLDSFSSNQFVVLGDRLYFAGQSSRNNFELWSTDGTAQGTQIVKDLYPGSRTRPFDNSQVSSSYPNNLQELNGRLLFTASTPTGSGDEFSSDLWTSDGTTAGTMILRDLNGQVAGTSATYMTSPDLLGQAGGLLYFSPLTDDPLSTRELWVTDGTLAGTRFVKSLRSGTDYNIWDFGVSNGLVYLNAGDDTHGDYEPWISDGTAAGTHLLKDLAVGHSRIDDIASSRPSNFTPFGDYTVFRANDGKTGSELWITDGTATGTLRVTDLNHGRGHSFPYPEVMVGDSLLFFANDNARFGLYLLSPGDQGDTLNLDPQTFTIPENASTDNVAGIVAVQPSSSQKRLTYAITGGTGQGLFAIDARTGELRVTNPAPLDFETTATWTLTVQVTDSKSKASASATITIQLTDQPELLQLVVASTPLPVSRGNAAVIDPQAQVQLTGTPPTNWDGTNLVVSLASNRQKKDRLGVLSQADGVIAKGKKLFRDGVQIGTITGGKGKIGTLRITFNDQATLADIESTAQQVGFTTKTAGERLALLQLIPFTTPASPAVGRVLDVS